MTGEGSRTGRKAGSVDDGQSLGFRVEVTDNLSLAVYGQGAHIEIIFRFLGHQLLCCVPSEIRIETEHVDGDIWALLDTSGTSVVRLRSACRTASTSNVCGAHTRPSAFFGQALRHLRASGTFW